VATIDTAASPAETRADELEAKSALLKDAVERNGLGGIRLRGQDWFAWATCGGSSAVLLASERGVAEVLVTADGVRVLTSAIEGGRLRDEELPDGLELVTFEWADMNERESFVLDAAGTSPIASDLPSAEEVALPGLLVAEKRRLRGSEIARYRDLGQAAAAAMTETLARVAPEQTELEVAGLGAEALLRRGIEPALVLVAGSRRVDRYRHPRPTASPIGDRVAVVFCGRRHGLYANLTRSAYFRTPTSAERADATVVARVEAAAWNASTPGATLGEIYATITDAYARLGHAGAERHHHQGGTTGYLSREALATPGSPVEVVPPVAMAWNPSLPGSKIEDTILRTAESLEVLTVDPSWPMVEVEGRERPDLGSFG
jgi:Xaa-Pro aminopeptidase